jgi:gliding motility-associated-like protein
VSPAPYCTNVPVSFFNSSTGQGLNFEWHFGSNGTSTAYEPDFTFLTSGIYTVTLIAVDSIGCKDSVDANLVINPGVIASFLYDPPVVCTGDNVEFSNISTGNPNSIFWDFGNGITDTSSNINNIVYNQSGTYQVTLIITDLVCLPDTFTQSIKVSDYPIVNLGPDTGICIGEYYTLYAGNPGMVYNWSTGETTQSIIVKEVPKVVVLYVSNNGCIGKDTVLVENDCPFFIPNAFTPNGDGLNDLYNIITDGTTEFRLNIYNRWGQQLFTTNDPTVGWDGTFEGTPEEMGVFIYTLELIFKNGVSRISQGNITLIR